MGLKLLPEDTFLLCTDGLSGVLEDRTLKEVLKNFPPEEAARRLGAEGVEVNEAPVNPQILLKWPLTNVRWEYAVECVEVEERREELPVRVWV